MIEKKKNNNKVNLNYSCVCNVKYSSEIFPIVLAINDLQLRRFIVVVVVVIARTNQGPRLIDAISLRDFQGSASV